MLVFDNRSLLGILKLYLIVVSKSIDILFCWLRVNAYILKLSGVEVWVGYFLKYLEINKDIWLKRNFIFKLRILLENIFER